MSESKLGNGVGGVLVYRMWVKLSPNPRASRVDVELKFCIDFVQF